MAAKEPMSGHPAFNTASANCSLHQLVEGANRLLSIASVHQLSVTTGQATGRTGDAKRVLADLKEVLQRTLQAAADLLNTFDEGAFPADIPFPEPLSIMLEVLDHEGKDFVQPARREMAHEVTTEDATIAISHQYAPRDNGHYLPNEEAIGFLLQHIRQCFASLTPYLVTNDEVPEAPLWRLRDLDPVFVELNKIKVLLDMIPAAICVPVNSIIMETPSAFVLSALETPAEKAGLEESMEKLYTRLEAVKCMSRDASQQSNPMLQMMTLAASGVYYTVRPSVAKHRSESLSVNPDINYIKFMWNLTEHRAGRYLNKMMFANILQHKRFYIHPDLVPTIARIPNQPPVKVRFISSVHVDQMNGSGTNESDDEDEDNAAQSNSVWGCIPLMISSSSLAMVDDGSSLIGDDNAPPSLTNRAMILHFHGGGFVAQSSFSHQNYTRQWSNATNLPVLSCDYRLAPENQFPAAVEDAWLCYNWCLLNARTKLSVDPTRIILAGDSAGGNLCAAITIRAIKRGLTPPLGLLLAYPCLCVSNQVFYPSMLTCLGETMLSFGFLLNCMKAYVPDMAEALLSPELSPSVVSDEILRQFPPTRIMVGTRDPLLDQAIEFSERLYRLGRDVKLKIYRYFGHGFLSFDNPLVGVPQTHVGVVQCNEWLRELADSSID